MPQKSVRNAAAIQSSEQGQSLFENISSVKKVILSIIYQREREKSPFPLFSPDANNTYF